MCQLNIISNGVHSLVLDFPFSIDAGLERVSQRTLQAGTKCCSVVERDYVGGSELNYKDDRGREMRSDEE